MGSHHGLVSAVRLSAQHLSEQLSVVGLKQWAVPAHAPAHLLPWSLVVCSGLFFRLVTCADPEGDDRWTSERPVGL